MPTGRVKWYDTEKGFGFLTRDDGGDVFVHKAALPEGVEELKPGQRVDFGVVESRKGNQALQVKVLANISRVLKEASVRQSLRDASGPDAFLAALRSAEAVHIP